MTTSPPKIDNAPGLTWKPRKAGWEARWQCRADIAKRGFSPKSHGLWVGASATITDGDRGFISVQCNRLQQEMLIWSKGGVPQVDTFDGTLKGLIACYQTDKDSPYRKLRFRSREHYDVLSSRVERDHGDVRIEDINARLATRWYEQWSANGTKVTAGHHYMTMVRILVNFGATFLEDAECDRVSNQLRRMRFAMGKAREERLTAEQVVALIAKAHELGKPSIALAQAFQFECMLRQKDVIGEWVPMDEVGPISDTLAGNAKWIRGLRWEEINENLVLRHITSKRQKMLEVPLARAQMVVDELRLKFPGSVSAGGMIDRGAMPANGPVIVSEYSQVPWTAQEFRRSWRKLATAAGIPKTVRNMDSRAGAISEATDAGAELEHVRHAATHGDISMTQRYSRGAAEKTAGVLDKRAVHRNKTGKP